MRLRTRLPFLCLPLLLALPLASKERRVRKSPPAKVQAKKRPAKPLPPAEPEEVVRERVERRVQSLLFGLRPSVASRVKTATVPFQAGRMDGLSAEAAWQRVEDSVRSAFGQGLTADQLEALALLVAGLGVTAHPGVHAKPLLAMVAERLSTRQDALQGTLDSVR